MKDIIRKQVAGFELMQILTVSELSKLEGLTENDSRCLWECDYDFAVLYSDHPDYCFIKEGDDVKNKIESWIKKIELQ